MSKTAQSEHLIECVRKHTVLYDTNSKEYSDAHLKIKLWDQIAKECGFSTGKDARNTWKNLRDGYRCSLKTAKSTKSGDAAKKTKPWKFSEQMNFLIPYMKDRPRSSNILGDGDSTSPLQETQSEVYDAPENVHDNSSDNGEDDEHMLPLTETPSTSIAGHITKKVIQQQTNEITPAKKKKLVGNKDETLEFLKEQAKKREERFDIRQSTRNALLQPVHDSLKLFFDSMYESTKMLPLPQQRQVRTALYHAVSNAELSAESQSVGNATPSAFSLTDSDDTRTSASFVPNVQATYGHAVNYVISDNDDYNIVNVVQNVSGPTFT